MAKTRAGGPSAPGPLFAERGGSGDSGRRRRRAGGGRRVVGRRHPGVVGGGVGDGRVIVDGRRVLRINLGYL